MTGDWNTPVDWDGGIVPNDPATDAVLPAASFYQVTIAAGAAFTVHSFSVGAGAVLTDLGTLTLGGGTSTVQAGSLLEGGVAGTAVGGTGIQGSGTLLNQGTIAADIAGDTLLLFDPHAGLTVTNAGNSVARNGGHLLVEPGNLTNLAGKTLTGGYYYAIGTNSILGLWGSSAAAAAIATDAADITLDGAGSEIDVGANKVAFRPIEGTLATIAAGGALHVLGARDYAGGSPLTDAGTLELAGGTYTSALTIAAGWSATARSAT